MKPNDYPLKFEPSDFECGWLDETAEKEAAACIAQTKFDKWLSEQPVVYGDKTRNTAWYPGQGISTHSARIVAIEPLKSECEHEPVGEDKGFGPDLHESKCVNCGIKLKAKWEAVK